MMDTADLIERLEKLNAIGIALSAERDTPRLIEKILLAAKELTHADGGTVYTVTAAQELCFEVIRNDSLHIALGGGTGELVPFAPIPLYTAPDKPNDHLVAAYAVLHDLTVNIEDAYSAAGFDFSGTRAFDLAMGYRSKSFLTIPMKNHEGEIIGALQLINAIDPRSRQIIAFSETDQKLVESLASQAAVALTNQRLIKQLEELFEAFIHAINIAIDEKSPHTGAHCQRVPILTLMLADAAIQTGRGPYADFLMNLEQRQELKIAALLHDCGKITTPVHVVEKATKLETLFDRIQLVDTRFEILKRDAQIACLREQLETLRAGKAAQPAMPEQACAQRLAELNEDQAFIRRCNSGGEFMPPQQQARVRRIAHYTWLDRAGESCPLLSENEVHNLTVAKGTLTPEERDIINQHVVMSYKMLKALPWPKHLRNVPDYAGAHHERMDGKGYPNGLTGTQIQVAARMIGIADVFEALTSKDRPYKKPMTLSQALHVLGKMKLEHHIDPDLFDIFVKQRVYLRYAQRYLDAEQMDEVDLSKIPGYVE